MGDGERWLLHLELLLRGPFYLPYASNYSGSFVTCFFIEVELIYNVVLVGGVQQSDSAIYLYIYLIYTFNYII